MKGYTTTALLAIAVAAISLPCAALPTPSDWGGSIGGIEGGVFLFGAKPGTQDGYDGQAVYDYTTLNRVRLLLYRENGPGWSGDTGFYMEDYESPIPSGSSKTWWDIRLWSHNYTPMNGDRTHIEYHVQYPGAISGWWGKLVLDYAPAHLNWTGPYEFLFALTNARGFDLPVAITDDPYNPGNVTRMHLTVYTYPVPEASSLAGLVVALGVASASWARRRRR